MAGNKRDKRLLREYLTRKQKHIRKLFRESFGFALAGILAISVDLAVFNLLMLRDTNASIASASATASALLINFLINYRTFVPAGSIREGLAKKSLRFGTVAAVSAVFLFAGFEIVLRTLPEQSITSYSVFRVLLIGIGSIARFFVLKFWVFR